MEASYNSRDAVFCACMSKASYAETTEFILWTLNSMKRICSIERIVRELNSALVITDIENCYIAFRGTEITSLKQWMKDFKCTQTQTPFGKIHKGFYEMFKALAEPVMRTIEKHLDKRLILCGHSMGGALALVFAAFLKNQHHIRFESIYTFGAPRCGDELFKERIESDGDSDRIFRFENNEDLIPRLPLRKFGYAHVGQRLVITRDHVLSLDNTDAQETITGLLCRELKDMMDLDYDSGRYHLPQYYAEHVFLNQNKIPVFNTEEKGIALPRRIKPRHVAA